MINRKVFQKILTVIVVVLFIQANGLAETLSTKDILGYSLDSLRSKMDSAVHENQKLSAKNSSIRKRILFLKKELRELDDEMIALRENAGDIKNNIKLSANELKIDEKRLNNFLERKRYLAFERDTLKRQLETLTLEQEMAEEQIQEMNFDIKDLDGSIGAPTSSNLLDYYPEEKARLLNIVQDQRQKIDELRNKIDAADLKISDQLRSKERALREQESLKRMVASEGLRVKEEKARLALLGRAAQRWRDMSKDQRNSFEAENEQLRKYSKEFMKVIEDFKIARQDIQKQFSEDVEDMEQYRKLLKKENEELYKYKKVVEKEVALSQGSEEQKHAALVLTDDQQEAQEERESKKDEVAKLQDKLTKQRQENESLGRDQRRLKDDLKVLASEVKDAKHSVEAVRKDAFGLKRKEIERAMAEQQARVKGLENKIAKITGESSNFSNQLSLAEEQAKQLQKDIEDGEAVIEELMAQKEDLMKQQQDFSVLAVDNVSNFRQEIAEAKIRKQALDASVDVVNKKYKAEEKNLEEFDREKAELSRYLEVLKKENMSLQKKLSEFKNKQI